jgi:hypothetical protein
MHTRGTPSKTVPVMLGDSPKVNFAGYDVIMQHTKNTDKFFDNIIQTKPDDNKQNWWI